MSCVSAIHHPLGYIDAASSNVAIGIDVLYALDRSCVNAHPQLKLGVVSQRPTDLDGAASRRFRVPKEDQCHAIPGRQAQQLAALLCASELCGIANNLLELPYQAGLLIYGQL